MADVSSTFSFKFQAKGHSNILATHNSTLEITKDTHLTEKGDCVIGVKSTHGLNDLPNAIKEKIKLPSSMIKVTFSCKEKIFSLIGQGDPNLLLTHLNDIVIRKSSFICSRTLCINSSHGAKDIPREFIGLLKNDEPIVITIEVIVDHFSLDENLLPLHTLLEPKF